MSSKSGSLFLLLTFLLFAGVIPAGAQAPEDDGFNSQNLKQDNEERITNGLQDLEQELATFEQRFRIFWNQNKEQGQYSVSYKGNQKNYNGMPAKNPLMDSQGVAQTSQQDYADKDTRVMLNPETFGQCYEERQVFEPTYEQICETRCGTGWRTLDGLCRECDPSPLGTVPCGFNQFYVSEVYVPVYQSRTFPGRAMGSFDPQGGYLSGQDQRPELAYEAARDAAYDSLKQKFQQAMQQHFGEQPNDEDIISREFFTHADYAGRDRATADAGLWDTQSLHTIVYMTNFNRQHSRGSRPEAAFDWVGYANPLFPDPASRCWYSTLPDAQKRVIGHSTYSQPHDEFTFALNHQNVQNEGDDRGTPYGHAMLDEGPQVEQLINQVSQQWEGNRTSQPDILNSMLGQYIEMNQQYFGQGKQRLGVQQAKHWQDYLYHSFFRLYHSRNFNLYQDPLYAAIASGFSFYTLNSLKTYPANNQPANSRPILWSFYKARPGGNAYAGQESGVGPNKIFSTDKIQVIYPTVDDGEKGSQCFRPESLGRSEYVENNGDIDKKSGTGQFWAFRRDMRKALIERGLQQGHLPANEVRVAYWIKRVNCHCTMCAQPGNYGCSVINNGDHPTDNFYGTTDLSQADPQLKPGGPFGAVTIGIPIGAGP